MKKSLKQRVLCLLVSFITAACTNEHIVYHSYHTLSHEGWEKSDTLFFHVPITDSLPTKLHLYAEIRNKNNYPFHNLHLIICHNFADTTRWQTDTIAFHLADSTGKWTGKGWGGIYQSEKELKPILNCYPNNYTIKVINGMKSEYLPGISNVGVRVEKQ